MRIFALFGRPAFLRGFHGWMVVGWFAIAVPGVLLWRDSVPFLVGVSIYANIMGHWSSWQAARVEVKQDEQIEEAA